MTYVVTIGEPRWARWRILAWLARATGASRRWEARGESVTDLIADLHRVAARHGATLTIVEPGTLQLTFSDGSACAVQVHADH